MFSALADNQIVGIAPVMETDYYPMKLPLHDLLIVKATATYFFIEKRLRTNCLVRQPHLCGRRISLAKNK